MELDKTNKAWRFSPGGLLVPRKDGTLGDPPSMGDGPMCSVGCGDDPQVWRLLQAGSPRLALARATGVPIVPLTFNIRASFPDTSTVDVPTVGMQGNQGGTPYRMVQDALFDSFLFRTINESETANQNQFQAESDYFYNWQSGIEAILSVEGQPRYQVVSFYTPLSLIADSFNGNSHWPYGWILKPNQTLLMSFHATVPLPTAPMEVVCTFRVWTTASDGDVCSNRQAFEQLCDLGYQVPSAVVNQLCR
jgi:hypothetical protein